MATAWGLTLTGTVTNQAWTKWAAQSTSHTFQALKIIFCFLTFHTWVVFYIPELFSVPKNTLFVSCFQAVCRPLVPRSGDYEQCRLKLAATVLCTTGNRHTVRRRHPTRQLKYRYFMLFGKLCSVDIYMIVNALLLLLCSGGQFALRWQIYLNIKMHGSFTCFTYPWKLYHTLSSARCLCFVMV